MVNIISQLKIDVKFAHIADTHLGYRQYGSEERAIDFANAFKRAVEFSLSKNVDFILVAGDLFHKKSEMDPVTLAQAVLVLEKCDVPVIAIEGNHDSTYFRERYTWIDYLSSQGHLINLKPHFDNGKPVVEEWDGKRGSYFEIGDARIYGLKYYGMLTEQIIQDFLMKVEKGENTIFMSHFGIEGYIDMYGCINSSHLYRFRDRIDYVALGHIHKMYVENDFIFNPGSLESCDLSEYSFKRGIFIAEIDDGVHYSHESSFYTPRTFRIVNVNFSDYSRIRDEFLKQKGNAGEIVHVRINAEKNIDREKVEKLAREIFDPLVLRIQVNYASGVLQAINVNLSDRIRVERNVISSILKGMGYEDMSEEVLRLREIFSAGNTEDADALISDILSEKMRDALKEVKKESQVEDDGGRGESQEDEEEWRWWEAK